MDAIEDVVRALSGPLELEMQKGYPDMAVIGRSIGEYVCVWAEEACSAQRPDWESKAISRVAELLVGYDQWDVETRRAHVDKAKALLAKLDGRASTARRRRHRSTRTTPRQRMQQLGYLDQDWVEARHQKSTWAWNLRKLGIETKRDLLYHFPRDYVPVKSIVHLEDGERAAVLARAGAREERIVQERRSFRLIRYALEIADETGKAWVTSFARVPRRGRRAAAIGGSPLALNYAEGTRLFVEGTVRRARRLIEIQHGGSEKLSGDEAPAVGSLVPLYSLTSGVYQGQIRRAVTRLLSDLPELLDPLTDRLRRRYRLVGIHEALRGIHWPASQEEKEAARRRLAFEELLTLQVALAQRKSEMQRPGSGISMKPRGDLVALLEDVLPFSLTRAQQRVISEIVADMAVDTPMLRMIQGDVGSGKTVVAAAALLIAIQSGRQGALMAPTELLAEQHYLVLSRMLESLGTQVELLTGSLPARNRRKTAKRIAEGAAQIIVGTHALIQKGVEFDRLGLVIVDEQHRFGVRQRAGLRSKGVQPDMLVMTATPIPRSLALTLYGDLELSVLDEMPLGRTPVETRWIAMRRVGEAYEFVRRQIVEGRQAYIVCPLIEESEKLQAEAATQLCEELRSGVFPDLSIGLLHGAMPVAEKDGVMQSFRHGKISVLCATTVIEVGVDVPNATVMMILNAERFGLAQLHQLRGRVGRGAHESYCILVTDRKYNPLGKLAPNLDDVRQACGRLEVMLQTTDGFRIAEQDLLLRGPGEFYGMRQHGMPDFRLARLARDLGVLEDAREAASWLIDSDKSLEMREHAALRKQVRALRGRMDEVAG